LPRNFFHVLDDHSSPDNQGTELPNDEAARREAIRFAGDILKDEADVVLFGQQLRMKVTDATGLILFHLDVNVTEAVAVKSYALR
jgi:hypothetical protein